MTHRLQSRFKQYARVFLLFAVGFLARAFGYVGKGPALLITSCNAICNLMMIGLFFVWMLSMRERMTRKNIYVYIRWSAILILFLLTLRILRYDFWAEQDHMLRMLWYLYYLPILYLPLLNLFAALCVGREEDYRVPAKLKLLYFAAFLLLVCVLTNDAHQLVFRFDSAPFSERAYSHGPLYYVIAAWVLALMLLFLVVLVQRCRLANSLRRAVPPVVIVCIGAVHLALTFALPASPFYPYLHFLDSMLMLCICNAAVWEACIASGLVVSNSRFGVLFAKSTLQAQILDNKGQVCYAAEGATPLSPEQIAAAMHGPVMLDENTRLNLSPIGGGCVLWTEDLTDVNRMIRKIRTAGENLHESNCALSKENEIKRRTLEIREQNRLYGKIGAAVSDDLQHLQEMLDQIDRGADARSDFARVCVCAAYIKRRINLLLLAENHPLLSTRELEYAVRESLHFAAFCGLQAELVPFTETNLASRALADAYARFGALLENRLDSCTTVQVRLETAGDDAAVIVLPLSNGKAGDAPHA